MVLATVSVRVEMPDAGLDLLEGPIGLFRIDCALDLYETNGGRLPSSSVRHQQSVGAFRR